ncbi:acyl-homoserine-lactone synthase [Burkholderia vietnamiensis]|uniref:acyl-homoserine-lactone synthase n=1 Tax=Burkholderia vietnamiensis TaxID=60552 RepID=UPI0006211BBB|nr:acyl-homoserine-lactone synthase [Burkholderia vietnamiensis]KKI36524.1 N-acyl homoserine lactone synthase [Burkholderia vietnamiensis]MBR8034379.1 GNAT family N-acetyltransferase [Burkholderia vietnamiensis]MCA8270156.1 GNAT family N-acetyltransferase [Burkholderia vietnamiensis]MDN8069760.1 acyl-homoserine-lactone synthase [Burkholderia vietnamiensis]UKV73588.1 GNAT family N-acetyltransferase [Burkholderia vietnamiensis]
MPLIIASRLCDLPLELRDELGAFRYDVFVRRLGWSLPDVKENETMEWDHFDGENTIQVVERTSNGPVCGCARLMPTTAPYLLRELLPRSSELDFPSSPTVWELSRFAGSGMQLFPYVMAVAALLGATRIIGVATQAIARLYRRFGLDLQYEGSHPQTATSPFVACSIALTAVAFANLGTDLDSLRSSITWYRSLTSNVPGSLRSAPRAPHSTAEMQ